MSSSRRFMQMALQEEEELKRHQRRAAKAWDKHEEQIVLAVGMLHQANQQESGGSSTGRNPNVERHRHSRGKDLLNDYFLPRSVYSDVDFRRRYRMQHHLFDKIMHAVCNYDSYFVQKCDVAGVLGLLPEQKLTAVIRMLAYGATADQVDEIVRMAPSTVLKSLTKFCQAIEALYTTKYLRRPTPADHHRLLRKAKARGFPGMLGSINCMHWQWKNCPTAWAGDYGNRKGQKSIILEAVASFDTWVWHAFFGVAGSQNDLNVIGQSSVFNDVLLGEAPQSLYTINNTSYAGGYYLVDGIYPAWSTFVKTVSNPRTDKEKFFASNQEGYRKDVERCFGILQARWGIIRGAARLFDREALRSIMMTCIILHNMIVEDEYDYDAVNPMESRNDLHRIYERPQHPNGDVIKHEPVQMDGRYNNSIIQRYTTLQSSYIHKSRQLNLIEHVWGMKA